MKNFYSEIDGVTTTFSDIRTTRDGLDFICVYFERPVEGGFHFLETSIPVLNVDKCYGFSELELRRLLQYARNNAPLLWKLAYMNGSEPHAASN